MAYMSGKLKGGKKKKRQYCQCGKGPLTLKKSGNLFKKIKNKKIKRQRPIRLTMAN